MNDPVIWWLVIAFLGGAATLALILVAGILLMLYRWMREAASWDKQ